MNKITTLFSAASLALAAFMALVACGDDSSSAGPDETPTSSSEETVASSSSNAAEEESDRIESQCTTPETKIGDVCSVSGYIVATGANYQDCYRYTEKGWTYMNQSFSSCRIVYHVPDSVQFLEMVEIKTECNAENEGLYEMVIVPVKDRGEETRIRYDFRCESGRWMETVAPSDIAGQCTKADTKIGDVCSIVSGGDVSAGIMPNILNCYVYTEEGWVSKASGSVSSTCEELLNAPADSTAAED